jgi:hypothetical protein
VLLELARRYGDIIQAIEVERFRIVGASYELRATIGKTVKDRSEAGGIMLRIGRK